MAEKSERLTYQKNMSKQELYRVIKAIGIPIIVFGLGLFTISNFATFGSMLICPLSGAMWVIGVVVAFLMPSQRQEVLSQTMTVCASYFLALLGLKILLAFASGVSSEMIAASYDQVIPTSTGNAIPGYLQTMMWFVAILLPMGDIAMQVKRLFQFKKTKTLQDTMAQKRGMRETGRANGKLTGK